MLNNQEVISLYETVAEITDQMLLAAKCGDWDRLAVLENRCADHVDVLKAETQPEALSPEVRDTKIRIIKKILDDDRQIRDLVQPWMAQLSRLMHSSGTERKLSQAYGVQTS